MRIEPWWRNHSKLEYKLCKYGYTFLLVHWNCTSNWGWVKTSKKALPFHTSTQSKNDSLVPGCIIPAFFERNQVSGHLIKPSSNIPKPTGWWRVVCHIKLVHDFHGKKTTQTRIPDHQPPKIVAVAHLRPQKAPTWCHKNCLKTSHWTFMVPVRNPPDFHSSMAFSMAIIHVKDIGCEAWGSLGS